MSTSREEAIRQIARAAVACEHTTSLPAEISAGICALESGWLKHTPRHNAFGIKFVKNRHNDKQLLITREWLRPDQVSTWLRRSPGREVLAEERGPDDRGRMLYKVRDYFAAYSSLEEAMHDLARIMSQSRYASAIASYRVHGNIKNAAHDIAVAGYTTTDPDDYAERIAKIVEGPLKEAINAERRMRAPSSV